jgi:hypothetical protein
MDSGCWVELEKYESRVKLLGKKTEYVSNSQGLSERLLRWTETESVFGTPELCTVLTFQPLTSPLEIHPGLGWRIGIRRVHCTDVFAAGLPEVVLQ